jgi:phage baseplate assembly protein V
MARFTGVIVGTVKDVDDPNGLGRIRVEFPWLGGESQSHWAPIAAPMAGGGRGIFFMPEVGDEAIVAFDHGDIDQAIVLGFLWNGQDRPPSTNVHERMIRSVNGHTIRFLDPEPAAGNLGAIVIEDAHGNRIVLSNAKITIQSAAVLDLRAPTVLINGRVVSPNSNPI